MLTGGDSEEVAEVIVTVPVPVMTQEVENTAVEANEALEVEVSEITDK